MHYDLSFNSDLNCTVSFADHNLKDYRKHINFVYLKEQNVVCNCQTYPAVLYLKKMNRKKQKKKKRRKKEKGWVLLDQDICVVDIGL